VRKIEKGAPSMLFIPHAMLNIDEKTHPLVNVDIQKLP
jgi:hypothetical protein